MHRSRVAPRTPAATVTLAIALTVGMVAVVGLAHADDGGIERTPAPEGAELYVISPVEGETVTSPVTIRFGLAGMGVAPAGVINPKTGHHHLILDASLPPMAAPLPNDANHLHFGGGQTEVSLELAPGNHTLQLVLGDHLHVPFDPPLVSKRVSIRVK